MFRKMLKILAFILYMSLIIVAVEGYNPAYQVEAVAGSTPNIDGVIDTGEWDDASTVSFNNTMVYVKQDGKNLYVAFNASDTTVSMQHDVVGIAIDVENNGGDSPQPDDFVFGVYRGGQLVERQGNNPPNPPTGGWNASASSTSNLWQAEFNITYAKISITPGEAKTLGIAFESFNYYTGYEYPYFWPPMAPMEADSPSNWGNLISEVNWVPEFPSGIFLSLFVLTSMLAVVFIERKIPRKLET